jgi:hypothetical protein
MLYGKGKKLESVTLANRCRVGVSGVSRTWQVAKVSSFEQLSGGSDPAEGSARARLTPQLTLNPHVARAIAIVPHKGRVSQAHLSRGLS